MADEGLTAGAVARRLGVAVTTLRTWHQRYGLGPSGHEPGRHRRYTDEDLDRLRVMRRLTAQGVAPAEAAAWARRAPVPSESPVREGSPFAGFVPRAGPVDGSPGAGLVDGSPGLVDGSPGAGLVDGGPLAGRARPGGGQVIPLGSVAPAARGLARAAMRLDAPAMRDILEMVLAERGVISTWTDVAMPVLIGIGERYRATRRFVEVEHLISRSVTEVFGSVPRPAAGDPPRVLLAAADEEQHTLPLEALAAALAEAGVPTRLLGGRVPPQALADATARTGPAVVVLWSQTPETGGTDQLERLATGRHPPLLITAAGPGWPHELPDGVVRLTTLEQAVQLVSSAVSPG